MLYENRGPFQKYRPIPIGMEFLLWKIRLYRMGLTALQADECCRTRFSVRRSTVHHAKAENGGFANRNFEKKSVTGSYYGSLAYVHLGPELRREKYGK